MADATEKITILLQAKDAEFQRALEKNNRLIARATKQWEQNTSKATKSLDANLKSAGASVTAFGKSFVAGLAVGAAATLFAGFTTGLRSVVATAADLQDVADRVGMTTDEFQKLRYGFKLAGVDAENFGAAVEKFTDNIGDAAQGNGKLKDILAANGIQLRDLQGQVRPTADLMADFADLVHRVPDEATRMSLVTEAFGRSGKALVLALEGGSSALQQMGIDATNAGAVLDSETIRQAAELDDRFDSLTATVQTFFMKSALGWAQIAEAAYEYGQAAADAVDVAINGTVGTDLIEAATQLREVLTSTGSTMMDMPGLEQAGQTLLDMADNVGQLQADFLAGKITADEFADRVAAAQVSTQGLVDVLGQVNGLDFSDIITTLSGLGGVIDGLAQKAAVAAAHIANLSGKGGGTAGASASGGGTIDLSPGKGGGGRRGGGGSGANNDAAQWFRQTRTEAEKYAADLAELDGLLKQGAITADTYQRAVEMIGEKYATTSDANDFLKNTTQDLEGAFLDAALTGENAFARIAQAIERAALQAALFGDGPLADLFGGGGGKGGGGLLSWILGGISGKKAAGGPVGGGKSYLVGERGPEIFTPAAAGHITPNSGIGGGAPVINITVVGPNGDAQIQAMVAQGVSKGLNGYDRHVLPTRVKQISADPRKR